jgi:hypothetical protein
MMRQIFTICALLVLGTVSTFANELKLTDAVILNNQKVFTGEIVRVKGCEVVFRFEGEKFTIPMADIKALDFANVNSNHYKRFNEFQVDPESCAKAVNDATAYHGKGGLHFALGVLFGPFTVIGAAVSSPSPASGANTAALSANKELFNDAEYLNCYKKKARGKNVGNSAAGWGAWIVLLLLL